MSELYVYAAEKFRAARRSLMLPHPQGEAASIAAAFLECSLALDPLDRSGLDDIARLWIHKLEELMDTTGLTDPGGHAGLWRIKAQGFDADDQDQLSRLVDELAEWFDRQT